MRLDFPKKLPSLKIDIIDLARNRLYGRPSDAGLLRRINYEVTMTSIPEQQRREQVRLTERSFQLLVEAIESHAIFMLDPEGTILSWNKGAASLKGYTPEEILGKNFSIFYPDSQVAAGHPQFELQEAARDGRYQEEGWRLRKDGTKFWACVTISAIREHDGKLIGFGKVVQDLTQTKLAQDTIRIANEQLEMRVAERTRELAAQKQELLRSNSDLEQFACIASHDLQEPIRTIISYLQLFKRSFNGTIPEQEQEYLDFALGGANRIYDLTRDLLTYARIQNAEEEREFVDFNFVVKEVEQSLAKKIAETKTVLTSDALPCLHADAIQMVRLLMNLVGNAIRYRRPDVPCHIHIAAKELGGRWTFSVTDNGIGIPPQSWKKVFEIFRRLKADADGHSGTGMGLAICKKIVERHGGQIWLESTPGTGTTFFFSLPKDAPKVANNPN